MSFSNYNHFLVLYALLHYTRYMYKTFTYVSSAAESASQREVDERLLEALSMDDPYILLDLRKLNGNINSRIFDAFWNEVNEFVHKLTTVSAFQCFTHACSNITAPFKEYHGA